MIHRRVPFECGKGIRLNRTSNITQRLCADGPKVARTLNGANGDPAPCDAPSSRALARFPHGGNFIDLWQAPDFPMRTECLVVARFVRIKLEIAIVAICN
jgi:hypothetical protein